MKLRIFIVLVAAVVIAAGIPVPFSFADDYISAAEYGEYIRTQWDTLYADGVMLGTDGRAFEYVASNGGLVEEEASSVTVRGWVVCTNEFKQFGYVIEGRDPVFSDAFTAETEQAVWDVAAEDMCDHAGRFEITADVSDISETTGIVFLIKFKTDETVSIPLAGSEYVGFDFRNPAKASAGEDDPSKDDPDEPTGAVHAEPIYIRFDDDLKTDEFFVYGTQKSLIGGIEYDYDKKCCVISVLGGEDPNVTFPFGAIAQEDGYEYFEPVSADEYKAMLIISRFDHDTVLSTGEELKGTFYFKTDSTAGEYSETRNMHYTYEKTDGLQYVIVDFSKVRAFKGELDDCRFDMFVKTDSDCEYELYYVGFFDTLKSAEEFAAKYRESGDSILPTPQPTKEPTPSPEVIPTSEATETPEATVAPEPDGTECVSTPEQGSSGKGCGGAVFSAAFIPAAAAAAVLVTKKKRTHRAGH